MLKALLNKLFGVKSETPAETVAAGGTGSLSDLQGFVEYVAKSLVDAPEEVRVNLETRDLRSHISGLQRRKMFCKQTDKMSGTHRIRHSLQF